MKNKMYRLSIPQTNIMDLEELEGKSSLNNISSVLKLPEMYRWRAIEAIQLLIDGCPSLKLCMDANWRKQGTYRQFIREPQKFEPRVCRFESENDEFRAYAENFANEALDIYSRLYDFVIVEFDDGSGAILSKTHHVISDAHAHYILVRALNDAYNGLKEGNPELSWPQSYLPYLEEEDKYLESSRYRSDGEYWGKVVGDGFTPASLSRVSSTGIRKIQRTDNALKGKEQKALEKLAKSLNVSPYIIILTLVGIYSARYMRTSRVSIGTAVGGRATLNDKNTMGIYVSTVPTVIDASEEKSFAQVCRETSASGRLNYMHYRYPYKEIQKLARDNDMSDILFQIFVSYQNLHLEGLDASWFSPGLSQYPLSVHLTDYYGGFHIIYDSQEGVFTDIDIDHIHHALIEMLACAASNENITVADLPVMGSGELKEIVSFETPSDAKEDIAWDYRDVWSMFLEKAELYPDRLAVTTRRGSLTYGELKNRAQAVASYLTASGVKAGSIVAIELTRTEKIMICQLAVLSLGAAYLPLDPEFPKERIDYILENSKAAFILDDKKTDEALKSKGSKTAAPKKKLKISEKDACYVIYTSGSTGKPKGTVITQGNVYNYCRKHSRNVYGHIIDKEESTILSVTTISFDIFVTESLLPLINGMHVLLADEEEASMQDKLDALLSKHEADLIQTTPSKLSLLTSDENRTGFLKKVKWIVLGGEPMDVALLSRLKKYTDASVYNIYGPTETTVWSSVTAPLETEHVTIGRPIAGTSIYILDEKKRRMPVGAPGALYIGGRGVCAGYFKNPELTAEKFTSDPFAGEGMMYETGDYACWNQDGELEFLGRADGQVKLHGLRIELGEIENNISAYPQVTASAVVMRGSGQRAVLCGFFTAGKKIDADKLRAFLSQRLTQYMVPSVLMQLDEMPYTNNGKIARNKLPEVTRDEKTVKPVTKEEKALIADIADIIKADWIGMTTDLFTAGMTSLDAIRISAVLENKRGIRIAAKDILAARTPAEILKTSHKEHLRAADEAAYPVYSGISAAQMGMYLDYVSDPSSLRYNIPVMYRMKKDIDAERLAEAFRRVIRLHPAFFLTFEERNGAVCAHYHPGNEPEVYVIKRSMSYEEFVKPFDLNIGPLYRINICAVKDCVLLYFDVHHIIFDAASAGRFMSDVCRVYDGEEPVAEQVSFAALVREEASRAQASKEEDAAFFSTMFEGSDGPSTIKPDAGISDKGDDRRGDKQEAVRRITPEFDEKIRAASSRSGVSPMNFLFAAFSLAVSRFTGDDDLVLSFVEDGRNGAETMDTVGMFVKTLPIRISIGKEDDFASFSKKVGETVYGCMSHDGYTVLDYARDNGESPSICFIYQNSDFTEVELDGTPCEILSMGTDQAKYDLSVSIESGRILAEYRKNKYTKRSIEALLEMFVTAARIFGDDEGLLTRGTELLTDDDIKAYAALNDTEVSYDGTLTVNDLFKKAVKADPEKTAIITEKTRLTFGELDALSDRLAAALTRRGQGIGSIVGICLERSEKTVIAELGVLKAGAAFLPMDIDWPANRKDDVRTDAGLELVIDDSLFDELSGEKSSIKKAVKVTPEDPCYVIYTSGSTGKPKGSVLTHGGLVNFCLPLEKNPHITKMLERAGVMLSITNPAFDASLHDIMASLLNGMTLAIAGEKTVDSPSGLAEFIVSSGADCMVPTPSRLLEYLKNDAFKKAVSRFKLMIVAAEAFPKELIGWMEEQPDLMLFNGYGPSECTIGTTYSRIEGDKDVFIGSPISNSHVFIMDKDGNRLPVNVPGELCIGGKNVGNGYLNRPELNKEKFTPDPLGHGMLYHTGDIGILDGSGELRFGGRMDDQVKINGQRVELGETEEVMKTYPGVSEAAAVTAGDTNKIIVGYYTAEGVVDEKELRSYLSERLTSYMVPAKLICLEKIPVTPNGKRDVKALKALYTPAQENFIRPETDRQIKIADMAGEVLGCGAISLTADLKGYGLNSLKAVMLNERICKEFGVELSSRDILLCDSVADMDKLVERSSEGRRSARPVKNNDNEAHLTMSQTSVWYETQLHPGDLMYNIPAFFELDEKVDTKLLEKALISTVKAHPVLLSTLGTSKDGKPVLKRAAKNAKIVVESGTDSKKARKDFVRSFAGEGGELFRMAILKKKKGCVLALDFHHIIFDGESQHIFLEDLKKAYEGEKLQPEAFDIFDYSLYEEKIRTKKSHNDDREFIKDMFSSDDFAYALPKDACYSGNGPDAGGASCMLKLPEELRAGLSSLARAWDVTEGSVFLTAFAVVLSKYERTRSLGLAVVEDGRIIREVNRSIGMFVRTLPLAVMLDGAVSFRDNTKKLQKDLYNTIAHGGFALAEAATEFDIRPRIAFTYNNYERNELSLGKGKGTFLDPGMPEGSSAKFDITLSVAGSELFMEYDASLYNEDMISRFLKAMKQCLINAAASGADALSRLEIISSEEKQLLAEWNDADEPYDREATIVSLFEKSADAVPDKLAVAGGGIEYTYRELETRANAVANALLARNINIGDI
ncbi:MAG: amino acid adenylation domain-containing protein, partial [Lachnospiraceae bacterium]|nr:amino acid adenylation domain-containing protein [Lachnospiraceae bacterium]